MRRVLICLAAVGLAGVSYQADAAPGTNADTDEDSGTLIPTAGMETFSPGSGGGSGPRCTWTKLEGGFGVDAGPNGSTEAPGTRDGPNGTEVLYLMQCPPPAFAQLVYVAPVNIADLRTSALRSVERQLPIPELDVSPSQGGIIRVQNWLAVAPVTPVSATASVGPVWITMTGTQDSLFWEFGDGGEVTCNSPTGSPLPPGVDNVLADDVNGAAPCGYAFQHVSAPQFGANDDLAFENSVTSYWAVTWVDYTGATGSLAPLPRQADWTFQVRQIQTQRTSGDD